MIQQPAKISEKEEEKIQQLFFDAFLEDVQFDQTQNAIFILAQKAFLAGYQAAKNAYLCYKGGQV